MTDLRPIGINIGCGHRPFASEDSFRWINVDLDIRDPSGYEYRQGDATKLPLDDGLADEVFSCHVIEHFWPWEVADVVKEWRRVLKPGGRIVVECPNLVKCMQLLVQAEATDNPKALVMAMNGLYGDRSQKELPMKHKWGYTPKMLAALLMECGFADVRAEEAQFKQKARDMRVSGYKSEAVGVDLPKRVIDLGDHVSERRLVVAR